MKLVINYTFNYKQPYQHTIFNPDLTAFQSRYDLTNYIKNKLTPMEQKELKTAVCVVEDINSPREFNSIPNWFLTCKGKFKFKNGKRIDD